jgi:hypothetical protein
MMDRETPKRSHLQPAVPDSKPSDHPLDRVERVPRSCIWEITAA